MFKFNRIRFRYQKDIYALYLVAFISSLGLIGPFMIKFFEDWGGLNQFWIFILQAFFTGWIFILEIPTGIVGDVWGRKLSYCIGIFLLVVGPFVYTWEPNLIYFFIGEFIFALGLSFISGSEEALIRDILKREGKKDEMSAVSTRFRNFHYLGMIVASLLTIYFGFEKWPLDILFLSGAPVMFISLLIVIIFVRDKRGGKERNGNSLSKEYRNTFNTGLEVFKDNRKLWSFAVYVNALNLVGYFVIWFYQKYMDLIDLDLQYYPHSRIVFLVGQICVSSFLVWLRGLGCMQQPKRQVAITKGIVVFISLGAFISLMMFNIYGLVAFLVLVGGLSINLRGVYSTEVNDQIPDEERATVLSFISMGRNASRTLVSPFFGAAVNINPSLGIISIMVMSRLTELFALPREEDFVKEEGEEELEES